ncbi:TlpA family protein disulfide reductase [Dethiosulfatarculus sandiegensis]|uniref:Thioredoxin domain-containing protein n=1 Tax=Dethiosulfatarculus sandiegensis TaxID=1429043 RepID=A0A0D2JGF1_9BACT|nr:TlpA disulfide reductase family protein [Dethiosulfatarculus sandiegensis]KIX14816.1 hypothetical protein X474_06635 [Dethiosulfatarculus sandiegensis]
MIRKITLVALAALFFVAAWTVPSQAGQVLDFDLPTVDGGRLRLSDFRGRVVILDFFASWCRPCKAGMKKLNKLAKAQGQNGVSVIGFALDKAGIKKVRPFVAKLGIDFPVVLGNMEEARRLTRELGGLDVVPTSLVIDPQGRAVKRLVGLVSRETLMASVRPHLKSQAPPEPTSAQVDRRHEGERRFQRIWLTDQQYVGGQSGFFVHIIAELADLAAEQGLWFGLHIRPEARSGSGLAPLDKPKKLFLRVDDASRRHFILFVSCDQLPATASQGVYRSWVTILGPNQKTLERSGDIIFEKPNCITARAR